MVRKMPKNCSVVNTRRCRLCSSLPGRLWRRAQATLPSSNLLSFSLRLSSSASMIRRCELTGEVDLLGQNWTQNKRIYRHLYYLNRERKLRKVNLAWSTEHTRKLVFEVSSSPTSEKRRSYQPRLTHRTLKDTRDAIPILFPVTAREFSMQDLIGALSQCNVFITNIFISCIIIIIITHVTMTSS